MAPTRGHFFQRGRSMVPPKTGTRLQQTARKPFFYFFALRFFLTPPRGFSIRKSVSFFPLSFIAATNQRGLAPRPAHVSPCGPRYLGLTFLPLNALLPRRRSPVSP